VIQAEDAIRARRKLTNKLIASKEAARLRPFFDPGVILIAGDGSRMVGAGEVIDAFASQFREAGFGGYVRETETVELDSAGQRASESGRWTAAWTSAGSPQTMHGTYLACWRKATGQWVIESELYITLG